MTPLKRKVSCTFKRETPLEVQERIYPLRRVPERVMMNTAKTPVLVALLTLSLGCTKKPEPEGYRVVSYDAATHQWTILRNGTFDGKYLTKRIMAVCTLYKWGDHEAVTGPDACHLRVGQMMIPHPLPPDGKRDELLDIFEMPDETLSITEGDGADRVVQQFTILKYEVLPDNANQ